MPSPRVVVGCVLPHDMSAMFGLPGAILLPDGPFLYHWRPDKNLYSCGVANIPLLPVGDCHDVMTCAVGHLCPHQRRAKVNGLNGFLLAGCLPFFMAGGSRQCWHCSRCVIGCGRKRSQSSGLLPLLLHPCGGRRHHGGEGSTTSQRSSSNLLAGKKGSSSPNSMP